MRAPPAGLPFALFPLVFFGTLAVVALTAGACSSGGGAAGNGAAADASAGRGLGELCEPSSRVPCVTLTDVCSVSVCDPASRLCVRVAVDAGPTCSHGPPPTRCSSASSGDCDGSVEAGDASADASDGEAPEAGDAGDAGTVDGASDAAAGEGGGDAAHDAPSEASDAGAG